MKFTKHLSLGFKSYIEAVGFIFKYSLWKYFIIPLILFGIIFYTGHRFEAMSDAANNAKDLGEYSWGVVGWFWLVLKAQFFWLLEFLFLDATKYLVMIFLSPLLAILSEKTEEILTGNVYKFNLKQLIIDVKRGVGIAIRMLVAEFGIIFLIWLPICKLFGVNDFVYELVALLIGFYFYGFAYIDYINERLRLSIRESWKFMKKHAGLAIAIGAVYSLFYKIPSLIPTDNKWLDTVLDNFGVLFAPVLAIVAATIAMHKLVNLNNSKFAQRTEVNETNNTL
ncbi:EI24 domain-containing protein [Flavobacteriales bacterium]|nr:EI24 domain-containing protein [Flavobacteriales bacterium]